MNFININIIIACCLFFLNINVYAGSAASIHFEFNLTKTTPLLHPPYISGIVNDANDVAFAKGIIVSITENSKPIFSTDYQIKIVSSDINVVAIKDVFVEKNNGEATIKIKPSTIGYSNITLTLSKGKNAEELIIYYAASATNEKLQTLWHTGFSDASAAIAIDDNYMIVGDDENNVLSIYDRKQSGLPRKIFEYENDLNLTGVSSKEVDCEAAAKSLRNHNLIYWTGSMGNGGKHFEEKPSRSTMFCTKINGTGENIKVEYKGYYTELRRQLIKWGDRNAYNFSASTAYGEKPKQIGGFNVEGMCFAPDSSTLYIAFRAPLVPITKRKNALIAPIKNFEEWFAKGHRSKELLIDKPIELDLDGRGFRDVILLSNKKYLIVAGNSDAEKNAAIYLWSGFTNDKPTLIINEDIKLFNIEAAVEITDNGKYTGKIQFLCDDGSSEFYNDGVSAKNLYNGFKKYRNIIISLN